ncbi:TonB-dependent receptor [bacterium]|nr:TonB-dependent receptor [bacterium]
MMRAAVVLAFAAIVAALPALAQDGDIPDEETAAEVVVAARRPDAASADAASFVEVIDMDAYRGRFADAADVLAAATGVRVTDLGGMLRARTLSIRGADPDQVVVMIDGVRVNPAGGGGADLSLVPLAEVERIEVLRGGAARHGSGGIGGAINIVTRRPTKDARYAARATYGSFDTAELRASASRAFGDVGVLVAADARKTDGDFFYRDNRGTEFDDADDVMRRRENNDARAAGVLAKVDANLGAATIRAHNRFDTVERGEPGLPTFPSPHAESRETQNLAAAQATFAGVLPDTAATLRAEHRFREAAFEDPLGEQTGVPIDAASIEHAPRGLARLSFAWPRWQTVSVEGGAGLETWDDRVVSEGRLVAHGLVETEIAPLGDALTLVALGRVDEVENVATEPTGKVGLVVSPWDFVEAKANVARTFRAPNFGELYENQGLATGNPDLAPERALSADAGLVVSASWARIEAVYFHQRVENLIEYLLVAGFRYKPFNIGRVRVDGGEAALAISPHPWIAAAANATVTYAIDDTDDPVSSGLQIPGRPRHLAGATLSVGPGAARVIGEFRYVGANYVNAAGTKIIPEREIWNIAFVLSPPDAVSLALEIKNLANELAQDVRGFPLPGRAVYGTVGVTW